jgi:orotate phosphoribosyltransferase
MKNFFYYFVCVKKMDELRQELIRIGCIKKAKQGEFWTLKSGEKSDIYIDLRILPQHPGLLHRIVTFLHPAVYDDRTYVAGLPIGGIPLATMYSHRTKLPLLLIRKVQKDHGTGKMVEVDYSSWKAPKKVILVDDVVTTGSTVLETMEMLKQQQVPLEVVAVVCVVNRSDPFTNQIPSTAIPVYSLLTLKDLFPARTTFEERIRAPSNEFSAKLFQKMIDKKSNLCVSADVNTAGDLMQLLKKVGPYIAMIKVHFDTIQSNGGEWNGDDWVARFYSLAHEQNVLVMNDRKYADIGSATERWLYPTCNCRTRRNRGTWQVWCWRDFGR